MRVLQVLVVLLGTVAITYAACPAGQWNNSGTCTACYWWCATCTGPNVNQCPSCVTGLYLQPDGHTCDPYCPFGYYMAQDGSNKCKVCDVSCNGCYLAAKTCINCAPGYHIIGANTCGPDAISCHTTCLTCTGPNINQCASCPPGRFLTSTHRCNLCNAACLRCNGPNANQCTACVDGKYLTATNTCAPCNAACLTCTGPNANQCASCAPGKYLTATHTCAACHTDCATCSGGTSSQCLSCKPTGAKPVLVGSRCFPKCTGTLLSTGQIKCTTCDVSCRNNNCRDASVNCVNCAVGYTRVNGLCV